MFKIFICAICQVELKPNQGISVHEDSSQPGNLRRWDGPFLCQSCQEKKEAMEGKRRSRGLVCGAVLSTYEVFKTFFLYTLNLLQILHPEIAGPVNNPQV